MKILFSILTTFLVCGTVSGQKYGMIGGKEGPYKNDYTFSITMDERRGMLTFETDAPVTVVTLEVFDHRQYIARKGEEFTNTYRKNGNTYSYDLSKGTLKDKHVYWLKVAVGRNGVPFAEYLVKEIDDNSKGNTKVPEAGNEEEQQDASGMTVIRTNATCSNGQALLVRVLKALDGVEEVHISTNGTVTIRYSSDGTPYTMLLDAICNEGFVANSRPAKEGTSNPCKQDNGTGKKGRIDKVDPSKISMKPNLLDATPGYRRAPIKYVPIQGDAARGYNPTKVYNWTDSLGNRHTATGQEILDEVNNLEKALNERGHSLREKAPFAGINFPLTTVSKNDFSKCVIVSKLKKSPVDRFRMNIPKSTKKYNVAKNLVASTVYSFLGDVITNASEFRVGWLDNKAIPDRNGKDLVATMELVLQPALFASVNTCRIEASETPGGAALFSTTFDLKKPEATIQPKLYTMSFGDAAEPQYVSADYTMRIYKPVFRGAGDVIPAATRNAKPYFLALKFYDAAGKLVVTNQPTQLILNNQLPMPLNVPAIGARKYAGYEYEFLDPGLHCFGFYSRSTGFSGEYFKQDSGYDGTRKRSALSGNMEIGVKYYNWERLINSNAALTKEFVLFGYELSSEEHYYKPDNGLPPIRVPGYKKEDADKAIITLNGKSYDLQNTNQTSFQETIGQTIANIDFFIGPVPCNISVGVSGTVSMSVNYESTAGTDIRSSVIPHADVTMHGSGGLDAKIMYAKVFADVNLLSIDMPYYMEVNNQDKNREVKIEPQLKVGGLSGQVYFQAGFCIPIPLVDDICESFRIDILNWQGFEKKFIVDPAKGITL